MTYSVQEMHVRAAFPFLAGLISGFGPFYVKHASGYEAVTSDSEVAMKLFTCSVGFDEPGARTAFRGNVVSGVFASLSWFQVNCPNTAVRCIEAAIVFRFTL